MALHCIRSSLSTSTNCTPHERLFDFQRKSATGDSIPTWLTGSKSALLKRHLRGSEYEPLVETVDILEVNPNYAHVRFNNGRETTVSLRHIAPLADGMNSLNTEPDPMPGDPQELDVPKPSNTPPLLQSTIENSAAENSVPAISLPPLLDNSQRTFLEDADSLNLRRSSWTHRKSPYLTENYQLWTFVFIPFLFAAWSKASTGLIWLEIPIWESLNPSSLDKLTNSNFPGRRRMWW